MLRLLALVLLMGCVRPAPTSTVCRGPMPAPLDEAYRPAPDTGRPSRVAVAIATANDDLLERTLNIDARNAPLADLLHAASEALRVDVDIDAAVAPWRIDQRLGGVTVRQWLELLQRRGVRAWIDTSSGMRLRAERVEDRRPTETVEARRYTVPQGMNAGALADAYCHVAASSRGRAASVGNTVIIADLESNRARFEEMMRDVAD